MSNHHNAISHLFQRSLLGVATTALAMATSLSLTVPATLAASPQASEQPQLIAQANVFLGQVRDRMINGGAYLLRRGYTLTHEPSVDALRDGRSDWITVNLRRGVDYSILAIGDQDCRDLDLAVYDENGNLIGSDIQPDDVPVVQILPRWTGTFRVRVTMANTTAAYSYYGVGVFGR